MIEQFKSSEIYHKLKNMQIIKKQLEKLEQALQDVSHHIQRFDGLKARFKEKKETVISQEQLIMNLADSIKRYSAQSQNDPNELVIESKNKQYEVENIRFQKA
jgi:CII-binding regulator of phage lambda lysogenization HflD